MDRQRKKNAGSPIFIVIIFIALLVVLFVVPEIYKRKNGTDNPNYTVRNGEENTQEVRNDKKAMSDYYRLDSDFDFKFNEISVKRVSYEEETLKLDISVDGNKKYDELDYYIELYKDKTKFLGRRILSETISLSGIGLVGEVYFVISHIDDASMPKVTLTSDESGLSDLVCSRDSLHYTYTFGLEGLKKVTMKYTYSNDDLDAYSSELFRYQKREKSENDINGVTASLAEDARKFIYTRELDYSISDNFSKIEDAHKFQRNGIPSIVKFKMEAEGFVCE